MIYFPTFFQGQQWLISFINDCNPKCLTFEQNGWSMPGDNGDLYYPKWCSNPPMKVENVDKDVFQFRSVTIEK